MRIQTNIDSIQFTITGSNGETLLHYEAVDLVLDYNIAKLIAEGDQVADQLAGFLTKLQAKLEAAEETKAFDARVEAGLDKTTPEVWRA